MDRVSSFFAAVLFDVVGIGRLLRIMLNIPQKYRTIRSVLRAPVFWAAVILCLLAFAFTLSII